VGLWEAIGTVLAICLVSFAGAWKRSQATERQRRDAERIPGLEAARDAEEYKLKRSMRKAVERDRAHGADGRTDFGLPVAPGAPRMETFTPDAPDGAKDGDV